MTKLAVLRHAPTAWNGEGRLQGRADIPVKPEALVVLGRLKVPEPYAGWRWLTSPLSRTRQTAAALGLSAQPDPRLIEMDWGRWEGRTLVDLRRAGGDAFTDEEARGLDLQPTGGESPREVQMRLKPLLVELAVRGMDCGAITHKGVIRALVSLAYDWPMIGKVPVKLDWSGLHVFRVEPGGLLRPEQINIPLVSR